MNTVLRAAGGREVPDSEERTVGTGGAEDSRGECHRVYLLLGSNQGDRGVILKRACALLAERLLPSRKEGENVPLFLESRVRETEPWGFESEDLFLNQAVCCDTGLSPREVLSVCLEIEKELGRVRIGCGRYGAGGERIYASRPIDIDLLLYDSLVLDLEEGAEGPALQVPHPRLPERLFALEPLAELAPEYVHPVLGRSVGTLLEELRAKTGDGNCGDRRVPE